MKDMEDNELTPEERSALESLRDQRTVFPGHEDTTVEALHRAGHLRGEGWTMGSPSQSSGGSSWLMWVRGLGLGGLVGSAFLLGVVFEKNREGTVQNVVEPTGSPVEPLPGIEAVAYHFELNDPFEESFSPADAHPKERMTRELRPR